MDPPAPFHHSATRKSRPAVGVGVVVLTNDDDDDGKVFAGRRKGSHGASKLALPGGHLELNESWDECARREVREEMGIELRELEYLHVTNDIMRDESKHYITIFMVGRALSTPKNCEPTKCEGWHAYTLSDLTSKLNDNELFVPLENLLKEAPSRLQELCGGSS